MSLSMTTLRRASRVQARTFGTGAGVFELRQYQCHPEHFGEFVALTNAKIHLRLKHSPLIGYWNVEFGAINGVVHLWHYDSLAARAKVRAALVNDAEWNRAYLSLVKPMWARQQTWLLRQELPFGKHINIPKANASTGTPLYEISELRLPRGDGNKQSLWGNSLPQLADGHELLGVFSSVSGVRPAVFSLVRHATPDHAMNFVERPLIDNQGMRVESTLMTPLPFSPMQ